MKKALMIAVMSVSMTAVFASNGLPKPEINPIVQEASSGVGIGVAMAAIRTNCPNATGDLEWSVSLLGLCPGGTDFVRVVTFWKVPNCPPHQFCIQTIISVGSVTLSCNDEVLSVDCGTIVLPL